ncbi:MAG: hypothetical protein H0X43_01825 [Nitrosospira sp.]|nr:hypothetical protein [Nitrosospira sp.]
MDGKERKPRWHVTSPAWTPVFTLLLAPAAGFSHEYKYREYDCRPDIKYECTAVQCEKISSGFQHAESFTYNTRNGEISACLWTNCYAASATVFKDEAAGTLTAIGELMPHAHPGNKPIIVSLTIKTAEPADIADKKDGNFTAVWGYRNDGLTFDMGKCVIRTSQR